MNAVEKVDPTMDNSVKMPSKKKSKNRKQQSHHQQSQGPVAVTKKIVPEKFSVAESTAPSVNGDTLDLINHKLEDNLHIKENGCMGNHCTESENSEHLERTENITKSSKTLLHSAKIHTAASTKQSNKFMKEDVESQGKNTVVENGNTTRPSSSKSSKKSKTKQQSTTALVDEITEVENTITPSVIKTNGNNNNLKSQEKQTCSAVTTVTLDTSSDSKTQVSPVQLDDLQENANSLKGNELAGDNSSYCQKHDNLDDENARTQNGALSPSSSSYERLNSNNNISENTIDKVTSLPKEIGSAVPTQSSSAVNGLDPSTIVIEYKEYESELQMQDIMRLIQTELSEPYSIYTYRYFIYNWPKLCFLAAHGNEYVGAIVCKLDMHMNVKRGYIAMLAVKKEYRKLKIGTTLVQKAIEAMLADDADEVVLETEMKNIPALRLYENLGFVRDKRLFRYYLNGVDALRLKLWFR